MSLADWIVAYGAVAALVSTLALTLVLTALATGEDDEDLLRRFARGVLLAPLWPLAATWALAYAVRWLVRTAFPTQKEDR